jgi:hypothetical protein
MAERLLRQSPNESLPSRSDFTESHLGLEVDRARDAPDFRRRISLDADVGDRSLSEEREEETRRAWRAASPPEFTDFCVEVCDGKVTARMARVSSISG